MSKRAKSDYTSLRTLTTYDASSTFPYYQQQYKQSSNSDMMHVYFPHYTSSEESFSHAVQSYMNEEAAAIWQQHYR
jgi:hypothetical protein